MIIEFKSKGNKDDQFSNINVAKSIIEHQSPYPFKTLGEERTYSTFDVEDLEEIANHLLAFCTTERKRIEEWRNRKNE